MKKIMKKRSRTVEASSGAEFDRLFNKASDEIDNIIDLRWGDTQNCVHIIYEVPKLIPETVSDELELKGIKYYCKDCPYLQKGKNKRQKSHGCMYAQYGTVTDFTPACEFFLKKVINGEAMPEVE